MSPQRHDLWTYFCEGHEGKCPWRKSNTHRMDDPQMKSGWRPAELVLKDLDELRDLRHAKMIDDDEYRRRSDELWDELREGDWERREKECRKQDRASDKEILRRHGYKSIKEALGDGWSKLLPTYPLVGGDRMVLSHHVLIKGYEYGYSLTHWRRLGFQIKEGEKPARYCLSPFGGWSYGIYTQGQVTESERQIRKATREKEQAERFVLPSLLGDLFARQVSDGS